MTDRFVCSRPFRHFGGNGEGESHSDGPAYRLIDLWDGARLLQQYPAGAVMEYVDSDQSFLVSDRFAYAPGDAGANWFRGAMRHAAWFWNHTATIEGDASVSKDFRLQARAYGQIYEVRIIDNSDGERPLTDDDHRRLIHLRREVRRTWYDAKIVPCQRNDHYFGLSNWEKAGRNEGRYGRFRAMRDRLDEATPA